MKYVVEVTEVGAAAGSGCIGPILLALFIYAFLPEIHPFVEGVLKLLGVLAVSGIVIAVILHFSERQHT